MKLFAIVITYYPDLDDALHNIRQYVEFVDTLFIWENTPESERRNYRIAIPEFQEKIQYHSTGRNEGIAYPLNTMFAKARQMGFTHVLTMDQDSVFCNFKTYKDCVLSYANHPAYAIFSPNVNDKLKQNAKLVEVPEAITSGCIYNLKLLEQDLRFREDYFIDMVDNEFCYQAHRKGMLTVALPHCHLKQNYGNPIDLIVGLQSLNYSAFRIYHIIRNYIVTWRNYPDLIQGKRCFIQKVIINRILKILFFETNKMPKLKAVSFGIYDGIKGRLFERQF